jgi:hypothetical protein
MGVYLTAHCASSPWLHPEIVRCSISEF